MDIDTDLDGGSIEVVSAASADAITLALREDNASDYMQWFHFRLRDAVGEACSFRIQNAGRATYSHAYADYRACASYDGERWFRLPTSFDGETLSFEHAPERDEVLYGYYASYPSARQEALIARVEAAAHARAVRLGTSLEGRPLDLIVVGDESPGNLRIWVQGRQHPGESMAAWFMEAFAGRLLDADDEVVKAVLSRAVFYLVPSMNPDGAALGNHRTNAAGLDLNRQWRDPDPGASPEVFLVRRAMLESGVDMFLDVHGDEDIPYCFGVGCEGVPDYTDRLTRLEDLFAETLTEVDDDFQREQGYDLDAPGAADMRLANNFVCDRFDCLSLTLEMPFKDNENRPDDEVGWSPERCTSFAHSTLEAVLAVTPELR
jgi:murein tripeptide amidase MpaA